MDKVKSMECSSCKSRSDVVFIETPYAYKLLVQEIESMGVQMRYRFDNIQETSDDEDDVNVIEQKGGAEWEADDYENGIDIDIGADLKEVEAHQKDQSRMVGPIGLNIDKRPPPQVGGNDEDSELEPEEDESSSSGSDTESSSSEPDSEIEGEDEDDVEMGDDDTDHDSDEEEPEPEPESASEDSSNTEDESSEGESSEDTSDDEQEGGEQIKVINIISK